MDISDILTLISIIINCLVIIIAPIISVLIAQKLQDRSKKRQDKMDIFKILMESRIYGWTLQSVNALNTIDIVFADEPEVIKQWRIYYSALWVKDPDEMQKQTMMDEREKLLEEMAKALGYKDKITLRTIQKPYMPEGMYNLIQKENQYKDYQFKVMEAMNSMVQNSTNIENTNKRNENITRKPNGHKHK